ncbi:MULTISPECIES: hypothetical protein [Neobacillus]|uniref:hypothetical protein n=1 Tax=Neobacillus TaxID=2675232 RepID=UPI0027DD6E38|nr:hypothetical protein [Neobacillus rhizophilus]
MSLPNFPSMTPTISLSTAQTVPLLLASIALEELALAHLVNTEAEKIQFVLGTLTPARAFTPATVSLTNLLALDASVQRTLRDVIKKEMLLEFKFENVLDLIAAVGGGGPTPGTCGCSVLLPATSITLNPPIPIPIIPGFVAAIATLNINICPSCVAGDSVFELTLIASGGLGTLGFTIGAISSVVCTAETVTIMGTGDVTFNGNPLVTGVSFTITINRITNTVTVRVPSDTGNILNVTITVPVPITIGSTCP